MQSSWEICEKDLGPFSDSVNKEPLLYQPSIFPRTSTALAGYFAAVVGTPDQNNNIQNNNNNNNNREIHHRSRNRSSSNNNSYNSDIGKSVSARQIARYLSLSHKTKSQNEQIVQEEEEDDITSSSIIGGFFGEIHENTSVNNNGSNKNENTLTVTARGRRFLNNLRQQQQQASTLTSSSSAAATTTTNPENTKNPKRPQSKRLIQQKKLQEIRRQKLALLEKQKQQQQQQHSSNSTSVSTMNKTSFLQQQHQQQTQKSSKTFPIQDFGGENILDLPHTAIFLPSQEIAVIDRDLSRVHIFAPNSLYPHRTILSSNFTSNSNIPQNQNQQQQPQQLIGPLGGCCLSNGDFLVCDMVGASVVVCDTISGVTKVRWLGVRSGSVNETNMRCGTKVYRAQFVMPKDSCEISSSSSSSASMNQQSQSGGIISVISDYASNSLVSLNHMTGNSVVYDLGNDLKPGALAYDSYNKNILVSDESRNRIFLLRDFNIRIGIIDFMNLLNCPAMSGSYGIAVVGNSGNNNDSAVIASNPVQNSVVMFPMKQFFSHHNNNAQNTNTTTNNSVTTIKVWNRSRPSNNNKNNNTNTSHNNNTEHPFSFPSSVTSCPYNNFSVVSRNTGLVHFLSLKN